MSRRTLVLCLGVCGLLFSCSNTSAPERNYGPLLTNLTEEVILPEHQDFVTQADALVLAVQALSDQPNTDSLGSAQAAWREARRAWRVLDAVQIGPEFTQGVAGRIDLTPVDAEGIEAVVMGTAAVDDQAVRNAGGKKKGFLGLEYLLFADPSAAENTPVPALADDDAAPRRRSWAISIADEIAKSAHDLDDAWEPSGGNYAQQLELAGAGGTRYATQRAAVDELVAGGVANALEYIVGVRLRLPLGLKAGGSPDPTQDPTLRSDNAVADMQASLSGVSALYQGDGFSAVLGAQNATLNNAVKNELDDSKADIGAIPSPFGDAVLNDTPKVQKAYETTRTLKTTWNTDVSSALGAIPKPSDTDGD